jgi:hypothetical protein
MMTPRRGMVAMLTSSDCQTAGPIGLAAKCWGEFPGVIPVDLPDNPTRHDIHAFVGLSDNRQISVRSPDRHDISLRYVGLSGADALGICLSKIQTLEPHHQAKPIIPMCHQMNMSSNEWVPLRLIALRGALTAMHYSFQNFSKSESSNGN